MKLLYLMLIFALPQLAQAASVTVRIHEREAEVQYRLYEEAGRYFVARSTPNYQSQPKPLSREKYEELFGDAVRPAIFHARKAARAKNCVKGSAELEWALSTTDQGKRAACLDSKEGRIVRALASRLDLTNLAK